MPALSLTADLYTEIHRARGFIGCSIHYINPCKESHDNNEDLLNCNKCTQIFRQTAGCQEFEFTYNF